MGAPRTVTISVPPELANEVDRQAQAEGRSRSELYREAARQYLQRHDRWQQIFRYGREVALREGFSDDDVLEAVQRRRHG